MSTDVRTDRPASLLARSVDLLLGPHGADRWIELLDPTFSTSEVRGRIAGVERETADSVTLTIEANRRWSGFLAGQHVLLTVTIDGVRHSRCYSMRSSARAPGRRFELTVTAQPGGLVSNHLVATARPGLVVGLSEAQGDFVLPAERPARTLLISGGSGITPVLSMLRTLCDEGHDRPVTFLHYCDTERDQVARAELDRLAAAHPNVRVVRGFTEQPGAGDVDGLFDVAHLDAADPDWREATTFLCGPQPLMDAVRAAFVEAGLADRVHHEAFALPAVVGDGTGGAVTFARSGCTVDDDGRTLLEQAEAAGLAPAHGCRRGICHTCTRTLLDGAVRDVVTGDRTEGRDVPVRICTSAPDGAVAVDL